jgi:hypothetical protein
VFNLAHDYSTALFNHRPEMILQGQDIPIHLGSLIPAMKVVAKYFEGDIHEGDLLIHNDPAWGGSHAIDTCFYKPVFWKGRLKYWTVCKGHLTDVGGPVPAGYNPAPRKSTPNACAFRRSRSGTAAPAQGCAELHPDQHARAARPGGRLQRPDRRLPGGRARSAADA